MAIASWSFAALTVAALVVFRALPLGRARHVWLLAVSYGFCATWGFFLPFLLGAITLADFVVARRLQAGGVGRDRLFWLAIAGNVGAVVVLRGVAGGWSIPLIGVSFYVMQAIACLADARSGMLRVPIGLPEFALYLAWFPRLVAGPIERAPGFLAQLARPRPVD